MNGALDAGAWVNGDDAVHIRAAAQARWPIDPAQLRSQGAATPFARQEATGQVRFALVGGQVAFEA